VLLQNKKNNHNNSDETKSAMAIKLLSPYTPYNRQKDVSLKVKGRKIYRSNHSIDASRQSYTR